MLLSVRVVASETGGLPSAAHTVMVALPATAGEPATANFRAPIVFNLRERLALQIVSRDERWGMQEPIDLAKYPRNEHGVAFS